MFAFKTVCSFDFNYTEIIPVVLIVTFLRQRYEIIRRLRFLTRTGTCTSSSDLFAVVINNCMLSTS